VVQKRRFTWNIQRQRAGIHDERTIAAVLAAVGYFGRLPPKPVVASQPKRPSMRATLGMLAEDRTPS
jgi:hypothetical protein